MKRFCVAASLLAITASAPALAADVGVSISVGEPGFYGQIDLGNAPPPALVYSRPIVVEPAPVGVVAEPMYLRVPPGYAKHWRKHCAQYHACGRPVYFVQDRWYNQVYVPHYRREHAERMTRGEHEGNRGERDRHHDNGRREHRD